MTEFSIYQINTDRDTACVCFLGYDSLEKFQHSKEIVLNPKLSTKKKPFSSVSLSLISTTSDTESERAL